MVETTSIIISQTDDYDLQSNYTSGTYVVGKKPVSSRLEITKSIDQALVPSDSGSRYHFAVILDDDGLKGQYYLFISFTFDIRVTGTNSSSLRYTVYLGGQNIEFGTRLSLPISPVWMLSLIVVPLLSKVFGYRR